MRRVREGQELHGQGAAVVDVEVGKRGRGREAKPARVIKTTSPIEFIELVTPTRETSGLVVRVGRVEVELARGFDVDTLARVLDVLEARA
jgi:hypothetical protein